MAKFPETFLWGGASAAVQMEGGWQAAKALMSLISRFAGHTTRTAATSIIHGNP